MMKNPGGCARYNFTRLNLTLRVDSFQPFLARARGLELEKDTIVFALVQLIGLRSVERAKLLIRIPYYIVMRKNDSK